MSFQYRSCNPLRNTTSTCLTAALESQLQQLDFSNSPPSWSRTSSSMPVIDLPWCRLYGPAWRSQLWLDSIVSIWDGRKDKAGHHCPDQSCATFNRDYFNNKLHAAFCLVVITLPDGQECYCGLRFAVESPSGCAKHPNSSYSENKIFSAIKKGPPYELSKVFPHEAPDWKMQLSDGIASIRMPLEISMDVKDGEPGFIVAFAPQEPMGAQRSD
jgi:hypothetical protein